MVCGEPRPCLLAMLLQQGCMQHDDSSQSEVKVAFTSPKETCTMSVLTICAFNTQPWKVTAFKMPTSDHGASQSTQETK